MCLSVWFFLTAVIVSQPRWFCAFLFQLGFASWAPPAPFGWMNTLFAGQVKWTAVWKGLETVVALGFLYLIRCSIHGAAMKKNVRNLQRRAKKSVTPASGMPSPPRRPPNRHQRKFSEALDIENLNSIVAGNNNEDDMEKAKPTNIPLGDILIQYGFSQFLCAAVGGFAVTPSVAASSTMYTVRLILINRFLPSQPRFFPHQKIANWFTSSVRKDWLLRSGL